MSRTLSLPMVGHIAGSMLSLTTCIKVTRLDLQVFGFTSLDADIIVEGVNYEANTSVDASEIASAEGSGVDNLDVIGLITSDRIIDTDILAGRWDGASIELFFVNFADVTMGKIPLLTGTFGQLSLSSGQYKAEIRSLSQRLSQQIVELTTPLCRVRALFDAQCMPLQTNENGVAGQTGTLPPSSFRFTATVSAVTSPLILVFGNATTPTGGNLVASGYYNYGRIAFTTGLNAGMAREVKSHVISVGTAVMTLQESFPFAVAINDSATIERGCDRTFDTCRITFKNSYNHQGYPALPGNDSVLTRGKR